MPPNKIRDVTITHAGKNFSFFGKKDFSRESYDFSSLSSVRTLLSNEKARMIEVIKHEKPVSIYDLSKKLNRNFRQVFDDFQLLKRFGLVEVIKEKYKSRIRHKPILISDSLTINIKL